jgi:hypothetical protein
VTYRFAAFPVNSDTRQVLADGSEVRLSPKAFELLLMLLQHRTRMLAKGIVSAFSASLPGNHVLLTVALVRKVRGLVLEGATLREHMSGRPLALRRPLDDFHRGARVVVVRRSFHRRCRR